MTSYTQASASHLIDRKTHKIVPINLLDKPFEADVLADYWDFNEPDEHRIRSWFIRVDGKLRSPFSFYRKVNFIDLVNVKVEFEDSYKKAKITFYEMNPKKAYTVKLECELDNGIYHEVDECYNIVRYSYKVIEGVNFKDAADLETHITGIRNFCKVRDLKIIEAVKATGWDNEHFSLGVAPEKFELRYRDKSLDYKSYALICGPWAILLDDVFNFDSIVALSYVDSTSLTIDGIIYSNNRYLISISQGKDPSEALNSEDEESEEPVAEAIAESTEPAEKDDEPADNAEASDEAEEAGAETTNEASAPVSEPQEAHEQDEDASEPMEQESESTDIEESQNGETASGVDEAPAEDSENLYNKIVGGFFAYSGVPTEE